MYFEHSIHNKLMLFTIQTRAECTKDTIFDNFEVTGGSLNSVLYTRERVFNHFPENFTKKTLAMY